ncbi:putative nuclease HARBI1 [Linepithema humile]|uniref:putative nuclease HARBI1 n=1 Tax=Linepithema humile TaxID=83485 RepID=UPI00351F0525
MPNRCETNNCKNKMNIINNILIAQEAEDAHVVMRRNRIRHVVADAFDISDQQFIKLFRLTKPLVRDLIRDLTPYMKQRQRKSMLDIKRKVLTALHFFAHGSYQTSVGHNVYLAMSQPSVSRCINEVANALNEANIMNQWIQFPETLNELKHLRQQFYDGHRFPGVIGCIDCTHIAIFPPQVHNVPNPEHLYVNRKGYHSINVQLVCDWRLLILNINATYPGSTHDSYIWNNSNLKVGMETIHRTWPNMTFFLLGDSGYPLRPWLLTPVANAEENSAEERYNSRQMSCRALIERCNGLLKMRFRCLLKHRVLHYTPQIACKIINACAILHNICIKNDVPFPQYDDDWQDDIFNQNNGDNEEIENRVNPELAAGKRLRNKLIRNYFT